MRCLTPIFRDGDYSELRRSRLVVIDEEAASCLTLTGPAFTSDLKSHELVLEMEQGFET